MYMYIFFIGRGNLMHLHFGQTRASVPSFSFHVQKAGPPQLVDWV